jgi:hypothetical protein
MNTAAAAESPKKGRIFSGSILILRVSVVISSKNWYWTQFYEDLKKLDG